MVFLKIVITRSLEAADEQEKAQNKNQSAKNPIVLHKRITFL
jgi:hypothetical protein